MASVSGWNARRMEGKDASPGLRDKRRVRGEAEDVNRSPPARRKGTTGLANAGGS